MRIKGLHFADVAEIQEAVTDQLKKVQKVVLGSFFRNYTTAQKPVYMPMELILNKKVMCLRFLKKSVTFWTALCIPNTYKNKDIWMLDQVAKLR
jgi:hypothetical protein